MARSRAARAALVSIPGRCVSTTGSSWIVCVRRSCAISSIGDSSCACTSLVAASDSACAEAPWLLVTLTVVSEVPASPDAAPPITTKRRLCTGGGPATVTSWRSAPASPESVAASGSLPTSIKSRLGRPRPPPPEDACCRVPSSNSAENDRPPRARDPKSRSSERRLDDAAKRPVLAWWVPFAAPPETRAAVAGEGGVPVARKGSEPIDIEPVSGTRRAKTVVRFRETASVGAPQQGPGDRSPFGNQGVSSSRLTWISTAVASPQTSRAQYPPLPGSRQKTVQRQNNGKIDDPPNAGFRGKRGRSGRLPFGRVIANSLPDGSFPTVGGFGHEGPDRNPGSTRQQHRQCIHNRIQAR